MTQQQYPIDDTLSGARGAAASLAALATAVHETMSDPAATPDELRLVAHTLQAQAQRASLGAMSLAAHAGRLEAYAVAFASELERQAQFMQMAQAEVEQEAQKDARLYLDDTAPGREPLDEWMAGAFAGQWEDFWEPAIGVERETVERWYRAAFTRAVNVTEA
jgi:hypothetical protein